jgi:hypothetical protein
MANMLEFLQGLLTNPQEQSMFVDDPSTYLAMNEFGDLSGEDVVEAMAFVVESLPDHVRARLAVYEGGGDGVELPPARPLPGETDLDAAIRQLRFATDLANDGELPPAPAAAEPEPPPEPAAEPEPEPLPESDQQPEQADEAAAPEEDVDVAREAAEEAEPVEAATGVTEGGDERGWEDSVAARAATVDRFSEFGEEMAALLRIANQKMEEMTARAEAHADAIMRGAEKEADALRRQAEEETNSIRWTANEEAEAIRNAAQSDAANLRQTASQEADAILQAANSAREEARIFKQAAHDDANAILQSARSTQDEAQRQATDLVENAEREANTLLGAARARRDEIREAERELRKRLSGVESVFRALQEGSVIPDDEPEG